MNFNIIGAIFKTPGGDYKFLAGIIDFLNQVIVPATITLTVMAAVFSICLAFMIMKAETGEKQAELKKRLWGVLLTIVIVIISVWLLAWLLSNFETIMGAIRGGK